MFGNSFTQGYKQDDELEVIITAFAFIYEEMIISFRLITHVTVLLVYFHATTTAFTSPPKGSANSAIRELVGGKNCLVLGPVARNGLAFEDVVLGPGRRILPGDTVACYYTGSFKKGGRGKPVIFDSISTCGSFHYSL